MIDERLLPSDEDVQFYRENGYWISDVLFTEEQIARVNEGMDRVHAGEYTTGHAPWSRSWNPGDDPAALRKTDSSHWSDEAIREVVLSEAVGAIAARLAGADQIRLWHDQMLYKPGNPSAPPTGANVGWHQDRNYWHCASSSEMLTGWAALVDVPEERGSMHFVPGSHLWGEIEGDFFSQDLDEMKVQLEERTGHEFKTIPVELKAGQVSFHHCLLLHASGPNRTDVARRSFAIHLQPGDNAYAAGTPDDAHQCAILMRRLGKENGDRYEAGHWPALWPKTPETSETVPGPSHSEITV